MQPYRYTYNNDKHAHPITKINATERNRIKSERGIFIERILQKRLLLDHDTEYRFWNSCCEDIKTCAPDGETKLFLIEIKDTHSLLPREESVLIQAIRQTMVARQLGIHSLLMVGIHTEVPERIRDIYDVIIRTPLLGRPLSDFNPEDYPDESHLGATAGPAYQDPLLNQPSIYTIEPRGSPSITISEQECINYLHGQHHWTYDQSLENIAPGPSDQDLLTWLLKLTAYQEGDIARTGSAALLEYFQFINRNTHEEQLPIVNTTIEPAEPEPEETPEIEVNIDNNSQKKPLSVKQKKAVKEQQKEDQKQQRKSQASKKKFKNEKEDKKKKTQTTRTIIEPLYDAHAWQLQENINRIHTKNIEDDDLNTRVLEELHSNSQAFGNKKHPLLMGVTEIDDESSGTDREDYSLSDRKIRTRISSEEKEKIKDLLTKVFSMHLSSSEFKALIRLFESEGIYTAAALQALQNKAQWQDQLRLMLYRAYRAGGQAFLPEALTSFIQQTIPQLHSSILLGESSLGTHFLGSCITSGITGWFARTAVMSIMDMIESQTQDHIQPLYHSQHRQHQNPNQRQVSMEENILRGSALLTLHKDSFKAQHDQQMQQLTQRFREDLLVNNSMQEEIASILSKLANEDYVNTSDKIYIDSGTAVSSEFTHGFLHSIITIWITRSRSYTDILQFVQLDSTLERYMNNPESKLTDKIDYMKDIYFLSYLDKHAHTGTASWSGFMSSLGDYSLIENQPAARYLDSSIKESIFNPETYDDRSLGIFHGLLFDIGRVENPSDMPKGMNRFSQVFPDISRQTHYDRSNTLNQLSKHAVTTWIVSMINDLYLDNEAGQQGLGVPIWINPHELNSSREAIRRLQGREHHYKREESYGTARPTFTSILYRSFTREIQSMMSSISSTAEMALLGALFLGDLAMYTLSADKEETHSVHAHRRNSQDADPEPIREGSEGTCLRRRRSKK